MFAGCPCAAADDRWGGRMQRAAEGRAIGLVGMTGEDSDDPIPVACHDRFQRGNVAEDERRVVVRWTRQATGMVEHDQIPLGAGACNSSSSQASCVAPNVPLG